VRSRAGAVRTILLFHIISATARPPKQPLFFVSRGLGCRMHLGVEVTELSTNKQHHLSLELEVDGNGETQGQLSKTRTSSDSSHLSISPSGE
jgi:hypothetical protein